MEGKSSRKVPGGKLVRATVRYRDGTIQKVRLTGDFFLYPEDALERIEEALTGKPVDTDRVALSEAVEYALEDAEAELVGVGPDDIAIAVLDAVEEGEL